MKLTNKAFAFSAAMLASTANFAAAENSDIMVGMTPKFLKDDFQTLMLDLSLKAFDDKGFTLVGAPDPNGDIAAQVDALQNLLANGANVIVFRTARLGRHRFPLLSVLTKPALWSFRSMTAPAGGQVTATVRADNYNAGVQGGEEMAPPSRK